MAAPLVNFSVLAELLSPPPGSGQHPNCSQFKVEGKYQIKCEEVHNLTGTGSVTLGLGQMSPTGSGFKVLVLAQDLAPTAQDVSVVLNTATAGGFVIPPGGFVLFAAPSGQDTPAIVVTHTADAVLRVLALG